MVFRKTKYIILYNLYKTSFEGGKETWWIYKKTDLHGRECTKVDVYYTEINH
jgi:hypothetical protein